MKTIVVTAGVIEKNGKILVAQRRKHDHQGLKWEFPGGKLEEGEDPRSCLEREILEELNIKVRAKNILEAIYHRYKEKDVLVLVYWCSYVSGRVTPVGCNAALWVDPASLGDIDFLPADKEFIAQFDHYWKKRALYSS